MSTFFALFSGSWHILAGIGVVLMALIVSWFGGKKIGKVQQKARSDVAAAQEESDRIAIVANKQIQDIKAVKNVHESNNMLNDDDARNKLRDSSYNNP
ncbi:hypothetical protein AAH450_11585 [Erwinia sp. P7711]|uniref:hypothetical protein n=1 Tax=Erwinia sp. P7711 TaxID=3141451 RepID=UPI0031881CF3